MINKRMRLGDLLVNSGIITEKQLEEALQEKDPNQKLGDVLLQKGLITEHQLIEVLEFQLGIPHVSLYNYPFDQSLIKLVPEDFSKRHLVIPLKKEGSKLYVAMADPLDYFAINDLQLTTGFSIEPVIATKDDIIQSIPKLYNSDELLTSFRTSETESEAEETVEDESSPIVLLVKQIIEEAVALRASDIHIDPHGQKLVIRYRIDGTIKTAKTLPKQAQGPLITRIKVLAQLDITEQRIPQDGRIQIDVDFHKVDLRVSTVPTIHGEKVVIRILDLSKAINNLNQLGFHDHHLLLIKELIHKPYGMILVTGPTGSGKSSTMYAALNSLNREDVNIITVEDPVEYQIEGINQIQVNPNVGLTFAAGLRAILRQDPNIIMVGEIRDRETAEMAVRASITGHLVLSTLHTNDAAGAIVRLKDIGVEPFLIASSLRGVISQRLIRKTCKDCLQVEKATDREKEIFAKYGLTIDTVHRGKGCPTCSMTGYRGRTAICEVLTIDDELRKWILKQDQSARKLQEKAVANGMEPIIKNGLRKVQEGITTTEEILRVVMD